VAQVKHGSAVVPIYRGVLRGQTRFTVAFYRDGIRQRRSFGSLDTAKEEAYAAALNIQRGMSSDNDLRPQDREAFWAAHRLLGDLNVPLVAAVDEYARCRRELGDVPLTAAVDEYVRRARGFTPGVTIGQAMKEFVAAKAQDRVNPKYLIWIERTLGRFEADVKSPIASITAQQLERWIRRGDHSVVTRNQWIALFKDFFNFSRRQGFLPKHESTIAEGFKAGRKGDTDVEIFTPEAMEKMLRAATEEALPILVIGGFAGLRSAEIARLDWSAVDLNRKFIELRAGQAKTASRRIVPIPDNIVAWLIPLKRQGPVVPIYEGFRRAREHAMSLAIGWPRNGLRHSYISYRLAIVQNAAQVALEAGNSPTIIFKHYRELVTKEQAEKWFAIMPA